MDITRLIRPHLLGLTPYSSARDDFDGTGHVFLDANENPYDTGLNRYPDPHQKALKQRIAELKGIDIQNIFVGNGSDEPIDLLLRAFCEPGKDNIIITPPTYGMYKVCAQLNNIQVLAAELTENFQLEPSKILKQITSSTKIIFLCSPNNPTGNCLNKESIRTVLENFNGLVVVDEAYIDFSEQGSLITNLTAFNNLVVLQTLSKAWGLAAARIGLCFAQSQVIDVLKKIKPPYNISTPNQTEALKVLRNVNLVRQQILKIQQQRQWLATALQTLPITRKVYPSDANFILVQVADADAIYRHLVGHGIIVRNRSKEPGCSDCLRITVGTQPENQHLIDTLNKYGA